MVGIYSINAQWFFVLFCSIFRRFLRATHLTEPSENCVRMTFPSGNSATEVDGGTHSECATIEPNRRLGDY